MQSYINAWVITAVVPMTEYESGPANNVHKIKDSVKI